MRMPLKSERYGAYIDAVFQATDVLSLSVKQLVYYVPAQEEGRKFIHRIFGLRRGCPFHSALILLTPHWKVLRS